MKKYNCTSIFSMYMYRYMYKSTFTNVNCIYICRSRCNRCVPKVITEILIILCHNLFIHLEFCQRQPTRPATRCIAAFVVSTQPYLDKPFLGSPNFAHRCSEPLEGVKSTPTHVSSRGSIQGIGGWARAVELASRMWSPLKSSGIMEQKHCENFPLRSRLIASHSSLKI